MLVDTTENKRLKNKTKREKQEYLKNLHACVYIGKAIECFCFFLFCALMVFLIVLLYVEIVFPHMFGRFIKQKQN